MQTLHDGAGAAIRQPARALRTSTVIAYGAGDFAFNLTFTFCSLFLLYFYTDVLGLSGTIGGLIILVALVWEGVTDPVTGLIANRTASRWGRYRPYLLLGTVPLALSFVLMFLPLGLSGRSLVVWAALTHFAYRTLFTVVNVPYVALTAQMTPDSHQRGRLAAARMIFAILCGITLSALTLPLVKSFGGGALGFFRLSLIYAAAAAAILFGCFASTREIRRTEGEHAPSIREMVVSVRRNRAFLLLMPATVLGSVAFTMSNKALVYYMKYVVGSEAAVTAGLLATLVPAALAMIPWVILTNRTSKRTVWLFGACITCTALLLIFLLKPNGGPVLYGLLALNGIGNASFILTFWSMLPDTVEYGEWRSGYRAEGAVMGIIMFSQKVALGIGTGLFGILLDSIGYVPNRPQTPGTLHGMLLLYTLAPLALFTAAAAIISFYPIDRRTHERLVNVVERQRRRGLAPGPARQPCASLETGP